MFKFGKTETTSPNKGAFEFDGEAYKIFDDVYLSSASTVESTKGVLLKLNFDTELCRYEHTEWPLDEASTVREEKGDWIKPSAFDQFSVKMLHILSALAPDVVKQINAGEHPISEGDHDWPALASLFAEEFSKVAGEDKKFRFKLSNYKGKVGIERYVANLNSAGNPYPKSNFFGGPEVMLDKNEAKKNAEAAAAGSAQASVDTPLAGGLEGGGLSIGSDLPF